MLSLDVYAWYAGILPAVGSIPSGVRYVPRIPFLQRFAKASIKTDMST